MSKQAQFMAEVKKVNTDGKKKIIQLEVVGKIAPEAFLNTVDMIGSVVAVNLGDSQMAIDFDEDDEREGITYTTDGSGVVMNISDQEEMDNSAIEGQNDELSESEIPTSEVNADDDGTSGEKGEPITEEDGSLRDNEGDEGQAGEQAANEEQQENVPAAGSTDKETLESFILSGQAPIFEGITFDFPSLLQRKRDGETWIELAKGLGVSSGKLQTEWREYKKLVAEHMTKSNNDGEQGAA